MSATCGTIGWLSQVIRIWGYRALMLNKLDQVVNIKFDTLNEATRAPIERESNVQDKTIEETTHRI